MDCFPLQGPREQPAIPAQAAADPHAAAHGLLHGCQHHLDGVSQWRPVSAKIRGYKWCILAVGLSVKMAWLWSVCACWRCITWGSAGWLSLVSSRWAWVLQDALGIAFCLYMLKTVRLPTFKVSQLSHTHQILFLTFSLGLFVAYVSCNLTWPYFLSLQACTLLLSVLFIYDVFFVFITPFFTKVWQGGFNSRLFKCLQSVLLCVTHVTHGLSSTERGEYYGGGSDWSLRLLTSWKGALVLN